MAVSYVYEPRINGKPGAAQTVYFSSRPVFAPEHAPSEQAPALLHIWAEVFEHNGTILAWDNADGSLSDVHGLNYGPKG
jgi:hypothetical protein